MRLNLLTKEHRVQGWWKNFSASIAASAGMHKSFFDLDDVISTEIAKYGGTFDVPFTYIEFEDEARANWFILRWS